MDEPLARPDHSGTGGAVKRRRFVSSLTTSAMLTGLATSYGTFAALAGRYLYPAHPPEKRWLYVAELAQVAVGEVVPFRAPDGRPISITRLADRGEADDFVALSSTCPHLGCQVHWETQNSRFFCPCHNGAFDKQGIATEGPPRDAGQNLARFQLLVERGLLFIESTIDA